jgi:hypothetical protein
MGNNVLSKVNKYINVYRHVAMLTLYVALMRSIVILPI